jgi:hypothetical protein
MAPTSTTLTQAELSQLDFTPEQIAQLTDLRARFDPFREACESNQQYERFCFLKWLYEHNRLPHDA